jgi:hypothetical protein
MAACRITSLAYVFDDDVGVELVQEFLEIRNVCLFNNGHLVCLFMSPSSLRHTQLVQIQMVLIPSSHALTGFVAFFFRYADPDPD